MKKLMLYLFVAFIIAASCSRESQNLIVTENELPGTTDWIIDVEFDTCAYPDHQFCRRPHIEGYCSHTSIKANDTLKFYVSTNPVSEYTIDIYRMGYYQGKGGNHKTNIGPLQGEVQVTPEADSSTNFAECNWKEVHELVIPEDWVSGVYLCKLTTLPDNYESYMIFIVKDSRQADFNFQASDMTWQSYNRWPYWHSMYDLDHTPWKSTLGTKVSFDRPYSIYINLLPSAFNPLTNGSGEFITWEFPLCFWMEEKGYDVTYTSNTDTHSDPDGLLRTKAFLSVGHDEYWTYKMVDNVKAARDKGVDIMFLSGNSVSGVVFLDPSSDNRPDRVMGRLERGAQDLDDKGLMGATSYGVGYGNFICQEPEHWVFEGTSMAKGDSIVNLIGWEFHGRPTGDQEDLIVLGESVIPSWPVPSRFRNQVTTIYTTESGSFVFNAGTCWWPQLLAKTPGYQHPRMEKKIIDFSKSDPRVQQMTTNLFERTLSKEETGE